MYHVLGISCQWLISDVRNNVKYKKEHWWAATVELTGHSDTWYCVRRTLIEAGQRLTEDRPSTRRRERVLLPETDSQCAALTRRMHDLTINSFHWDDATFCVRRPYSVSRNPLRIPRLTLWTEWPAQTSNYSISVGRERAAKTLQKLTDFFVTAIYDIFIASRSIQTYSSLP